MDLIDYFPPAQVINLPDRTDRRREMESELVRLGLQPTSARVEFFAAFRPSRSEAAGWPSIGARGCFMSHLAVLERARDRDWPAVLVMEDDVSFHARFDEASTMLVRELASIPWDFAYLGHRVTTEATARPTFREHREPLETSHFYAVNRRILTPLIDYLHELARRPPGHPSGGPMHVDGAYNMFRAHQPEVTTVIATPSLAGQRSSSSDIHPAWFDVTPGLRHLVRSTRRLARHLKPPRRDA